MVDHPALGQSFPALDRGLHFSVGGDGGRHVENDGPLVSRNRHRDRVGRKQQIDPAPGRHVVGVADREIQSDHVVLERHRRVQRRRARVVAAIDADPGRTGGLRFLDRGLRGEAHHHMPHAVVAVDERHSRGLSCDAHLRLHVDRARADPPHVLRQAENSVAVGALEIGAHHQIGADRGVLGRQAHRDKRVGGETLEAGCGESSRGGECRVRFHGGAFRRAGHAAPYHESGGSTTLRYDSSSIR